MQQKDPCDEDENEHSTYTLQTDVNDVPEGTGLIDITGMIDMEVSSVHSSEQMHSAIKSMQGTIYVPQDCTSLSEYNNPDLWICDYPWLFPYGKGGPEIKQKVAVSLKAYKHLLLLADRTFSHDCPLKFHLWR